MAFVSLFQMVLFFACANTSRFGANDADRYLLFLMHRGGTVDVLGLATLIGLFVQLNQMEFVGDMVCMPF